MNSSSHTRALAPLTLFHPFLPLPFLVYSILCFIAPLTPPFSYSRPPFVKEMNGNLCCIQVLMKKRLLGCSLCREGELPSIRDGDLGAGLPTVATLGLHLLHKLLPL